MHDCAKKVVITRAIIDPMNFRIFPICIFFNFIIKLLFLKVQLFLQGFTLHFSIIPSLVHFLSSPKENRTKRKVRKRPGSEAGCPIFQITQ